jgi:hypothetical protein
VKLLRIDLHNVRGAPDGALSFTDTRTGAALDVALITGGTSSGKTSVLEAIAAAKEAVGAYGAPADGRRLLRRGASSGRVEATWLLSEDERARASLEPAQHTILWNVEPSSARIDVDPRLRRLFADLARDPSRGKVEYFPANRGLDVRDGAPLSEGALTRLRLTREPDKYAGLLSGLRALALDAAARARRTVAERGIATRSQLGDMLAPFGDAISAMVPHLRLSDVELEEARDGLRFVRRDRTALHLVDLSDGERQGVLFALAFRYFGLSRSLVLVDEPELHIHAADRVRFLQALVTLGRDNQIIAATGSAEIVAAAAPGQLIDLSALARRGAAR